MTIEFYTANVYGNHLEYIKDPELAKSFYTIAGRKTLTPSIKQAFRSFGVEFSEALPPRPVA